MEGTMLIAKAVTAMAIVAGLGAASVSLTGPNPAQAPDLQTEVLQAVSVDSRPGAPVDL
jgi:hypothetical protein